MQTPIGQALKRSRRTLAISCVLGAALLLSDLVLVWYGHPRSNARWLVPLAGLAGYGVLAKWDRNSLGLRLRPIQGYAYWIRVALAIGIIILGVVLAVFALWKLMGWKIPAFYVAPSEFWPALFLFLVCAPLMEEGTFRFVVCTPAAAAAGPWGAILISGTVFAGLHFMYGRASPDNLIAGYFLAWVYLKSGSILVPIALHSLGNLVALCYQLANYHWVVEAAR